LKKKSTFRGVEKLVPIVIYCYCKQSGIPLSKKKLLRISELDDRLFNIGMMKILKKINGYFSPEKLTLIGNHILTFAKKFGLDDLFMQNSQSLLNYLWKNVFHFWQTSEAVAATLVASIAVFSDYTYYHDTFNISIHKICRHFGVSQSVCNGRTAKHIIKNLGIPDFQSFVRSADSIGASFVYLQIMANPTNDQEEKPSKKYEIDNKDKQGTTKRSAVDRKYIRLLGQMKREIECHYPAKIILSTVLETHYGSEPSLYVITFLGNESGRKNVLVLLFLPQGGDHYSTSRVFGYSSYKGPPDPLLMIFNELS
jgi:hypothetical protein